MFRSALVLPLLLALSGPVAAQFEPSVTTSFDALVAEEATRLSQEITFFENDEELDTLFVNLDIGDFDFDDYAVDDVVGGIDLFVEATVLGPIGSVTVEAELSLDLVVTEIDGDVVRADAIVASAGTGTGTGTGGIPVSIFGDIDGDVAYELTFTDLDDGVELSIESQSVIPSPADLGGDLEWTLELEPVTIHGSGPTLTVTTTLDSTEASTEEVIEEFEIESDDPVFLRGDANGDTTVSIIDGLFVLEYLFLLGDEPPCLDAADANDTETVSILDTLTLMEYLFLSSTEPPAPGPDTCGTDPDGDAIDCESPQTDCP